MRDAGVGRVEDGGEEEEGEDVTQARGVTDEVIRIQKELTVFDYNYFRITVKILTQILIVLSFWVSFVNTCLLKKDVFCF